MRAFKTAIPNRNFRKHWNISRN